MTSTRARKPPAPPAATRRSPFWPIVAAIGVVALILAVVFALGGASGGDGAAAPGDPTVTGQSLPRFDADAPQAGLGMAMPEVAGTDFDGEPVAIAADGSPTAIVFLAHWCTHCQTEVPAVQAWLDDGGLPDGTQLIGVSTATDPGRDNYPPEAWLEREGWSAPLVVDSADGAVAEAFGLSGFPYWVLVDADGVVVARTAGLVDVAAVGEALSALAG